MRWSRSDSRWQSRPWRLGARIRAGGSPASPRPRWVSSCWQGLALVGAGAAAWRRRPTSRFGPLLFLAGLAWFVPEWNNPAIGNSALFTAGLVLGAACLPLVAHAALGYPGGRLRSRAERAAVGLAYLACVGLIGVLPALFFDPAAEGCAECPHNLFLVTADAELAETVRRIGLGLRPLWSRSSSASRRGG